ncbi:disintegrin and metalloproteinase domain-containing protein 10-like isoform X2 [Centruroides sculpturatus]|uniref:disintegrin and metalloproteinase domain-containing protein 10-like isoform X2 n=1 Tax=Centruroides sculpturatus TaxID=218467 RepID=UPI000C6E3386|nr:disintegrin and metalloproteinase domain-containing protein 10-like isoform X2 [Centruroides sculpturatus]
MEQVKEIRIILKMYSTQRLSIVLYILISEITIYIYPNMNFILNYEIIDIQIIVKEGFENESSGKIEKIIVKFYADKRNFRLSLQRDLSSANEYLNYNIFIYNENITKINLNNLRESFLYSGTVIGEEHSAITGYFHNNIFIGRITMKYEVYYVEAAYKYFEQDFYVNKMLFYKETDILSPRCLMKKKKNDCEKSKMRKILYDTYYFSNVIDSENTKKQRMIMKKNQLLCVIDLIADHTFVKFMNYNTAITVAEMLYHVKLVDRIFSSTDFDNDGIADRIGFVIGKIKMFANKSNPRYPIKEENIKTSISYLNNLSKYYQQNICLVIAFCHRNFLDAIGAAFIDGLCISTNPNINRSFNIVFVSSMWKDYIVPRSVLSRILLHEVGHSFGSKHDNKNNIKCSPRKQKGKYVMHNTISTTVRFNNWKFSPCSKRQISKSIIKKIDCFFNEMESVCGNAITEKGEECDCGPIVSCQYLDPCCYPPGSIHECTLKKHTRNFCSPREGVCCTEDCRFIPKSEYRTCYVDVPCRKYKTICNGKSSSCPEIYTPKGSSCHNNKGRCLSNGTCYLSQIEDEIQCQNKAIIDYNCLYLQKIKMSSYY